jgi:hypothetical protein
MGALISWIRSFFKPDKPYMYRHQLNGLIRVIKQKHRKNSRSYEKEYKQLLNRFTVINNT